MNKKIEKFLNDNKIKYEVILHKKVFTAIDKAATLKIKQKLSGKTLVLRADKDFVVALIPANKNLNKDALKKTINFLRKKLGNTAIKKIDFASETQIKKVFKGAKTGAVVPFGVVWRKVLFVDKSFLKEKAIFINSGDYFQSLKISPKIFQKLPDCFLGSFSKAR
jgi:prolyl-tRNA editing enzyme YbaK/EbsC (Cys-tRNA(Pro) deacylase)